MEGQRTPHIILASTSPRRKELLASLNLSFEVMPSHADESTPEYWTPEQIVEVLAVRKAEAVLHSFQDVPTDHLIIGSDTIVVLDGEVLGKPADDADAVQMLSALQGRTHEVFTGVACIHTSNGKRLVSHRRTSVTMKAMDSRMIAAYTKSGESSDKAGAYAIQGLGATLVESIQGCYFNVVGLPLSLLTDMLSEFGVRVLEP